MCRLLVEEDITLAEAVCDGLQIEGLVVDHIQNAGSAKAILLDHPYVAVILDVGLPGESGLTVIKTMRSRYDDTPVIILTAGPVDRSHSRAGRRGGRLPGKAVLAE